MTFLFLLPKVELSPASSVVTATSDTCNTSFFEITRTGQGVTLLNFEPDTTFKCLNELLYLLTIPALDTFFRDDWKTEETIHFVVDNGPAEQQSSPLVQMSLVRLLKLLTQVSFAE